MSSNLQTSDWVNIAYKKLKNSVYFDKTQLPLVDKIVSFENEMFEENLNEIASKLDNDDDIAWQEYVDGVIGQIEVLIYPKKLCAWQDEQVIFNADNEPIEMEKAQYFIDMQVIGHILGVLWVLTVGAHLDNHDDPDNLPILSARVEGGKQRVFNLTAVILPYRKDDFKFAHVVYHQKVHFSPEEKRQIEGYRLQPAEGGEYQLFQWKDVWFPVYCCFELASIAERALFQSLADLVVAVEWNPDVPYFSNIIESLCRDLHCYCMQVNSSDFGDSRVISPRKTDLRDIIKTKGGTNHTILTEEIDIDALRSFQRMEYELQKEDGSFKPTPPNFEPSIPEHKQKGTLWDNL